MIKDLIGFSVILMGVFSLLNFISHHSSGSFDDKSYHDLVGILLIIGGIVIVKSNFKLGSWDKFK